MLIYLIGLIFGGPENTKRETTMKNSIPVKLTLILSGLIAVGFGSANLFVPHLLHASSGLTVVEDVNLLNEMKSSAGMLLVCGLFALFGAVRNGMAFPALVASAALYATYGVSRLASVVMDGVPNSQMLQAMGFELGLAALCLIVLWTKRAKRDGGPALG